MSFRFPSVGAWISKNAKWVLGIGFSILVAIDFGQIAIGILFGGLLMAGVMASDFKLSKKRSAERNRWLKDGAFAFVGSSVLSLVYLVAAASAESFPALSPLLHPDFFLWVSVVALGLAIWEFLRVLAIHFNPSYRPSHSIDEYATLVGSCGIQAANGILLVEVNWASGNWLALSLGSLLVLSFIGFARTIYGFFRKTDTNRIYTLVWFSPWLFVVAVALGSAIWGL
jgi:hypothetical protein